MILYIHIVIALTSVGVATLGIFRPSKTNVHISYGLIGSTLASGIYLIFSNGSHLVQACLSGICYIAVVAVLVLQTKQRLTAQSINQSDDEKSNN